MLKTMARTLRLSWCRDRDLTADSLDLTNIGGIGSTQLRDSSIPVLLFLSPCVLNVLVRFCGLINELVSAMAHPRAFHSYEA
jgi:hypothetical protein